MKFAVDQQEQYTVYSLQEENLNTLIAPEVKSSFVVKHSQGVKNLILDLSAVKFVDSSGLSAILTANRLWGADGHSFILTGVQNENVKKLIEISKLTTVFTIIPTVQEAIDYVLMEEVERQLKADSDE